MSDNESDDFAALLPPASTAALTRQTLNLLAGCLAVIIVLGIVTYLTTPL
ncbi:MULTISPECIES: hypothetical protein [Mycolicibacterium]|nr:MULTISPECIES: hypothetical protein [Mycobacteriaceae]